MLAASGGTKQAWGVSEVGVEVVLALGIHKGVWGQVPGGCRGQWHAGVMMGGTI